MFFGFVGAKQKWCAVLISAFMLVSACGKKKDKEKDKEEEAPAPAGSLVLSTEPAEMFNVIDAGVASSLSEGGNVLANPGQLTVEEAGLRLLVEEEPPKPDATEECTSGGYPISSDSSKNTYIDSDGVARLPATDPSYAAGRFFCMLSQSSGDPLTVRGTYYMAKALTCVLGADIEFDGEEHEFDYDFAETDCFGKKFQEWAAENSAAAGVVTYTATNPAAFGNSDEWDTSIDVTLNGLGGVHPFKMLFKTEAGVGPSMHIQEICGRCTEPEDSYAIAYDLKNGILRYESTIQRQTSTEPEGPTHIKLLVKGVIDAESGEFESLTEFQGAYGAFSLADSSVTSPFGEGEIYTINGTTENGFKTVRYRCSGPCSTTSLANWDSGAAYCFAESGDCEDVEGIAVGTASDLEFIPDWLDPNRKSATPGEWFESAAPLTFDSVELAPL